VIRSEGGARPRSRGEDRLVQRRGGIARRVDPRDDCPAKLVHFDEAGLAHRAAGLLGEPVRRLHLRRHEEPRAPLLSAPNQDDAHLFASSAEPRDRSLDHRCAERIRSGPLVVCDGYAIREHGRVVAEEPEDAPQWTSWPAFVQIAPSGRPAAS
jgi:hypothetical protein